MVTVMVIIAACCSWDRWRFSIVVTDRNISRQPEMMKDAFYLADAGHPVAVSIIEAIAQQSADSGQGFSVASNLKNEVMDYYPDNASLNDGQTDSPERHRISAAACATSRC